MIIYPAIDLRKGKCVRLYQGDYAQETIYHDDFFTKAKSFVNEGAKWLHIVDLDGAKNPAQSQTAKIIELIKQIQINVQTGGGIRTKEQIKNLLDQGAARVILGSIAVLEPNETALWFDYFGAERLVLALDIIFNKNNEAMVTTNAWQNTSHYKLNDLIRYYRPFGLKHVLCTNIALDGTLNGPDDDLYQTLLNQFPFLQLQASGGIHTLSDVYNLRKKNLSGAIIGRALYENKLNLREVLSC